jgi:hypothetical protein
VPTKGINPFPRRQGRASFREGTTNPAIFNEGCDMPEEQILRRAERDKEEGKSAGTRAGEFVREEMRHIREGKHGARSPQQAIALTLSAAKAAPLPPDAIFPDTLAALRAGTVRGLGADPPAELRAPENVPSSIARRRAAGRRPHE